MDSKSLKKALKDAVEHIKKERFAETVKICKVSAIILSNSLTHDPERLTR